MAEGYGEGGFGESPYGGGGPSPGMGDINGSFERAGVDPGEADQWNFRSVATGFGSMMAYFGLGAQEDFSWIIGTWLFLLGETESAAFGTAFGARTYDDFETSWNNSGYSISPLEILPGIAEAADFSGNDYDDMDWIDNPIGYPIFSFAPFIIGNEAPVFPVAISPYRNKLKFRLGTDTIEVEITTGSYVDWTALEAEIQGKLNIALVAAGQSPGDIAMTHTEGGFAVFENTDSVLAMVALKPMIAVQGAWDSLGFEIASEAVMRRWNEDVNLFVGLWNGADEHEDFETDFGFGSWTVDWDDPGEATFSVFAYDPGSGDVEGFESDWDDWLDPSI